MSREEYLNQLHKYLRKLPRQEYEDAMEYFTEYFQETDEEGAEELMKELGTPKEAARELMANLLNKKIEDHQNYETDGQTRAEQIIAYREKHGAFASIEGIMEVDGIKQGTFDKLKDNITVQ